MKIIAFIFSSGKGTRLQPYTIDTPKPLLPLNDVGDSMLDYILEQLVLWGIEEAYINYSYGKDKFQKLIAKHSSRLSIKLVNDEQIVGQGGILLKTVNDLKNYDAILCLNGDTYIDLDHGKLIEELDLNAISFLSDNAFDKAKPYLLLNPKNRLVGYQSPTRDDLYFFKSVQNTQGFKKVNYLGLCVVPVDPLLDIKYDGTFLGLFGRDDLFERLYERGVYASPLKNIAIKDFLSIDTCEEYERLLKKNGSARSILHTKNK